MYQAENHRCHRVLPIAQDLLSHGERYRISVPRPQALLYPRAILQQHVSRGTTPRPLPLTASVSRIPPVTAVDILWLTGAIAQVTNIYQISVHALSGAEEPV